MSAPTGSLSSQWGGWLGPSTVGRHKLVFVPSFPVTPTPIVPLPPGDAAICAAAPPPPHPAAMALTLFLVTCGRWHIPPTPPAHNHPGGTPRGRMGQTPCPHWGGGRMGQTPWRHPRGGGGGWDKKPGATPLLHPHIECESCRTKGEEG